MSSPEPERNENMCDVCKHPIEEDEEKAYCDACDNIFHMNDCGGWTIAYGIETCACDNCREYRNE